MEDKDIKFEVGQTVYYDEFGTTVNKAEVKDVLKNYKKNKIEVVYLVKLFNPKNESEYRYVILSGIYLSDSDILYRRQIRRIEIEEKIKALKILLNNLDQN